MLDNKEQQQQNINIKKSIDVDSVNSIISRLQQEAEKKYAKGTWLCFAEDGNTLISSGKTQSEVLRTSIQYFKDINKRPKQLYVI